MFMRQLFFGTILFLLMFRMLPAQLTPGVDYSNQYFWIVFQPYLENIQIQHEGKAYRSGFSSVDELFAQFQVQEVVREVPFAGPEDRYGDIVFENLFRVKIQPTDQILEVIARFGRDPHIVLAEAIPIYRVEEIVPFTPNDSYYSYQWHLPKIQADYAWGMWQGNTPGSDTVVVAIIDTGVDWDHPDLIGNIFVNPGEDIDGDGVVGDYGAPGSGGDENGIDDDGNGKVDDLIGWDFCGANVGTFIEDNDPHSSPHQGVFGMLMHGTHVAGTASPSTNNGIGVAGPGFQAKILPIKVAFDNDINNMPGVYASSSSYLYAAKTGAHILNCSFGGPGYSGVIQSTINLIHSSYGVIVVAAAGNDNQNTQYNHHYPSDYQNVISVAALNSSDLKASFSNYGPTVDISAPGVNIWSTVYKNVSGGYQGSGWSGTSMASPVVAGSYALLKAFFPLKSNTWLEQRLLDSTDPIDNLNPSYAGLLGTGRVNIYSAIAQGIFPSLIYQNYSLEIIGDTDGQLNPGETALMRVTLKNEAGWNTAAGIEAVLRSPTGELIISDSTANYPNISGGSIGINLIDRFEFTVDSNASIGNIPVELYVTANQDSTLPYDITLNFEIEVSINQPGWPQNNTGAFQSSPVVADLDNNGTLEVVATSTDNNVYVWEADGTPVSGFPYSTGNQIVSSPAVGDVDNNGDLEIVVASKDNHLYLLNHDGSVMLDYDAGGQLWGTPTLIDLDGNGDLEIVFGDFNGKLFVINHDGSAYGSFPIDLTSTHRILSGVAVGDLNNDATPDIVFGTFNGDVYAISSSDASTLSGFPVNVGARVQTDPVIADLDGSGPMGQQMVVTSINKKLSFIDGQGTITAQYSYPDNLESSPSLADLDNDGAPELFFGCNDGKLYVIDHNGNNYSGFPVSTGNDVKGSPVLADVNGDGSTEIAFVSTDGNLYLVGSDGTHYTGFPITIGGLLLSTPTFDDVDGDGDLELLVGTGGSLNVYDIPGSGSTANLWSTFQGNYLRTGNYTDVVTGIQDGFSETVPMQFRLGQNYPNPFNPITIIPFTLPERQQVELQIFNLLGQKVRTLTNKVWDTGRHQIIWDGRDDHGNRVSSGIYFYRMKTPQFTKAMKMMYVQ